MSDLVRDPHAWFRARLDARALDLLDEDEARRIDEHASTCAACEAIMKAYAENRPISRPDGHIPARIIARWDRARGRLRGLPRQLVREHLESCAECRQDLEALGFPPVLEVVVELEAGALPESEDPLPIPEAPHRIVVIQGARRGRWATWAFGGVAGAGVAVAAMFAFVPNLTTTVPNMPDSNGTMAPVRVPVVVAPVVTASPGGGLFALPPATVLRASTRSGGEPVTTVVLSADGRHMHLQLPGLYLPDSTSLVIELRSPGGERVVVDSSRYGQLRSAGTIVLESPDGVFAPGEYRLMVAPRVSAEGSTFPQLEFPLRVTR